MVIIIRRCLPDSGGMRLEGKLLLALDTSTQTMGIALYDEPVIVGEMIWRSASHHTVELAPAVGQLMNRCAISPGDLKAVAVALGPGSFTSLRIGLALAKGLSLSSRLPVVGIPTFDFLVAAQPLSQNPLIAVLPAGRSRMAAQWFTASLDSWQPSSNPIVLTPEEISDRITGPTHIIGEMTASDRQVIGRKWKNAMLAAPVSCVRRPSMLAQLAWERWKEGKVDDPVSLAPIYLHVAEAIPE